MSSRGQLKNVSAAVIWTLCLSRCPPEHPARRRHFPFLCVIVWESRLNWPNLLCFLSRVSATPSTSTPSDTSNPDNLQSNVFQIKLLCLTQWQETQRERIRLPGWCGDCNVTSPSLRPEDSCGPFRMMDDRLGAGAAAACRVLMQM